jgi:hypothetical protein
LISTDLVGDRRQRQVSFEISAQKKLWANKDVFAGLYYGFDHYAFPGFEPEGQHLKDRTWAFIFS